jgi:hypothetical protein
MQEVSVLSNMPKTDNRQDVSISLKKITARASAMIEWSASIAKN